MAAFVRRLDPSLLRLIAVTDALGQADAFEYDRFHRMTAATLKTAAFPFSVTTAGSVAINITTVQPVANGYLTAYPSGTSRPNADELYASDAMRDLIADSCGAALTLAMMLWRTRVRS